MINNNVSTYTSLYEEIQIERINNKKGGFGREKHIKQKKREKQHFNPTCLTSLLCHP